jgi:hypothetical protein
MVDLDALRARLRVQAQLRKEGKLPPLPPPTAAQLAQSRKSDAKFRKWEAREAQLRKEGKLQQLAAEKKEFFRLVISPPKFPNEELPEPTPELDQFPEMNLTPIPKRKRKRKKKQAEELDALAGFHMMPEEKIGKALGLVLACIIALICGFAVCNKMNSDIARDQQQYSRPPLLEKK